MATKQPETAPAGRPHWDPMNGFRVGALTGGVVGILVSIGLSVTPVGPVAAGAIAGGILGYRTEKQKQGKSTRSTTMKTTFTTAQAEEIATEIGLDFAKQPFDVEQFRMGLDVELEHGNENPRTNVTANDPATTGKIAWAHLNEFPDYYTRLAKMEAEAHAYWDNQPED